MGEARRRAVIDEVTRRLVERGKLIEAGWMSLQAEVFPSDMPAQDLADLRMVFFAGAQHLWASINAFLDEDHEPTDADMQRMDAVNDELNEFVEQLKLWIAKEAGHG